MCFEWFTKGQHDLESDVQQQLFKEKILKLESYEITMNGRKKNFAFFCSSLKIFFLSFPSNPPSQKQLNSLEDPSGLCLMLRKTCLYIPVFKYTD